MDWDDVGSFFNSDMGKQLTNVGTQWLTNELKLTGSTQKNPAVIQPTQTIVQQAPAGMDNKTMYWIIGGVAVVGVALIFIMRK